MPRFGCLGLPRAAWGYLELPEATWNYLELPGIAGPAESLLAKRAEWARSEKENVRRETAIQ
jgi:hypothetical protein